VQEELGPEPFVYPAEDDYETRDWYKMSYAEDVADSMEIFQGIAEFWQPARASLSKDKTVGALGKLRREWANGWDSLDVQLYLAEIQYKHQYPKTVFGGNVITHENRQRELIRGTLEEAIEDGLDDQDLQIYVTKWDREFYKFILRAEKDPIMPYEETTIKFHAGIFDYVINIENIIAVGSGDLPPGWQAEGFWACLGNRSKTRAVTPRRCNNLGGGVFGEFTPEWNTTHGVCGKNVGDPANSDLTNYFGGLSIGDLGFWQERRLVLSGGDVAASYADPGFALHANDGFLGSVAGNITEDVSRAGAISREVVERLQRGLPKRTLDDIRESRE
jgi:hypothetical protein